MQDGVPSGMTWLATFRILSSCGSMWLSRSGSALGADGKVGTATELPEISFISLEKSTTS